MFGLLALLIRHDIHIYFGYYPTRQLVYWLNPRSGTLGEGVTVAVP